MGQRGMAGKDLEPTADERGDAPPPQDPSRSSSVRFPGAGAPPEDAEPEKARREIAAGDVADDLADFA